MKKKLESLRGERVEVKSSNGIVKGLLCKALITSTRPDEWFIYGVHKHRFVESEIDYIRSCVSSSSVSAIIVLRHTLIPTMANY